MNTRAYDFRTIMDDDWCRMLRAYRASGHYCGSDILRRIRARVVAQSMVPPPQPIPNLPAPKHAANQADNG